MNFLWAFFIVALFSQVNASEILHRILSDNEKKNKSFVWEETQLCPFNELIVSWDAKRPTKGAYLLQVSLLTSEWSPWVDYAFWAVNDQYTFKKNLPTISVCQDAVQVLHDNKASGFRIRVTAEENSALDSFRTLHSCSIDSETHGIDFNIADNVSVNLKVKGLSQIALSDERRMRLCSPTSTTAVINFLSGATELTPIEFANSVVDTAFDIYGNWILNTAQASHMLGKPWHCYVARLTSFDQIIEQLKKGFPVVISIKGPLNGSASPYESGHLLVVTGYNSKSQEVYCMDPGFSKDDSTHVKYPLNDFLTAWSRRQGIAYIFDKTFMELNAESQER